jgi:hypothetical protein
MYEEALALGVTDEDKPRAVFRRGLALNVLGDPARIAVLEEARTLFEIRGDDEAAGEASAMLAEALWHAGSMEEHRAALSRAQELAHGRDPSAAVARVRAQTARYAMLDDDLEKAIRVGREALQMAETLGSTSCGRTSSPPSAPPCRTRSSAPATRCFERQSPSERCSTATRVPAHSTISPCPRTIREAFGASMS